MLPQDVSGQRGPVDPAITQAWDPYDVWLKRVKQPRDRRPQRHAPAVAATGPLETPAHVEPRRLIFPA